LFRLEFYSASARNEQDLARVERHKKTLELEGLFPPRFFPSVFLRIPVADVSVFLWIDEKERTTVNTPGIYFVVHSGTG